MRAELRATQVVPGDLIVLDGRHRPVVGSLLFDEDGTSWREHCLEVSPGTHEWLSVRPRGVPGVLHWTTRHDLLAEPDPDGLTLDGRTWALEHLGRASYTALGHTGTGRSGGCVYAQYRDAEGALVLESFDSGMWEVSVGRSLDPAEVHVYREVAPD